MNFLKETTLICKKKLGRTTLYDDFTWKIKPVITKPKSIALFSSSIPWVHSNIHSENNTLHFNNGADHVVYLTTGNYDSFTIVSELRKCLKSQTGVTGDYSITFNDINARITITPTGALFDAPNKLIIYADSTCASIIGLSQDTNFTRDTATELQRYINLLTIPHLEIRILDNIIVTHEGYDQREPDIKDQNICDIVSMSGYSPYEIIASNTISSAEHEIPSHVNNLSAITVQICDSNGWTPTELYDSDVDFTLTFIIKHF